MTDFDLINGEKRFDKAEEKIKRFSPRLLTPVLIKGEKITSCKREKKLKNKTRI